MNMRVVIPAGFKVMPEKLDAALSKAMVMSQALLELGAKANVPVRTANLQRSIASSDVASFGGKLVGTVGVRLAQAKYGGWVEEGTGTFAGRSAWTITPKKGKMLAFKQPAGWAGPVGKDGRALARIATVKGQKGKYYLARSAEENRAKIAEIFQSAVQSVVKP